MEKQKSPAARASKESVFPNHLQGVGSISKLFTGAFYHYGHSVEQILKMIATIARYCVFYFLMVINLKYIILSL
ncbi:hypothetical protein [Cardinium endosymbiont of Philonthus spinipes]|uniref:hypothetical protein n=1 Tax=Cardinium endosymbiont of Philonthus spinipes TaxID=3077941 RepID=UPI00313A7922